MKQLKVYAAVAAVLGGVAIAPVASAEKGTIGIRFRTIDPPPGTRPNMAVRIRVIAAGPGATDRSN